MLGQFRLPTDNLCTVRYFTVPAIKCTQCLFSVLFIVLVCLHFLLFVTILRNKDVQCMCIISCSPLELRRPLRAYALYPSVCLSVCSVSRAVLNEPTHRSTDVPFLPCDAMHSAAVAGMQCPSVCLSVCHVRELRQND